MESHTYQVDLKYITERKGEISSPVLDQKIEVATPPEFPKGMPGIWSPEHLFTAAVSSCFMTTFLAIAENSNLEFSGLECPAEGVLGKSEGKFAMTEITLRPLVTIANEADREKAEKIMVKAEKACLISNSVISVIHLETSVLIQKEELV